MSNCSSNTLKSSRIISIAPMMDHTDRHFRYFFRLVSKHAFLYTEMYTINELMKKDPQKLLVYDQLEHPLALQLGGSDPDKLAYCAKIGEDLGYDEINLNIGCPSNKVQQGGIGACLMKSPSLVAECVAAMRRRVTIPVTIKCRLGVDKQDGYAQLSHFVSQVADAGCAIFMVHARKAWLKGLNPKQNRALPPLQYEQVYQLKQDFPHLEIIINGGITNLEQIGNHLENGVDGVMIGREAYHNPYFLHEIDALFYGSKNLSLTREEVALKFIPYLEQQLQQGEKLSRIVHHLLGLFHGIEKAKSWRKALTEGAKGSKENPDIIMQALAAMK